MFCIRHSVILNMNKDCIFSEAGFFFFFFTILALLRVYKFPSQGYDRRFQNF